MQMPSEPLAQWEKDLLAAEPSGGWQNVGYTTDPTAKREYNYRAPRASDSYPFVAAYKPEPMNIDPDPSPLPSFFDKCNDPDCNICREKRGEPPKPDCKNCAYENEKGGIARGIIAQIADVMDVDLSENVGGDRWSRENMKRVVPAVKKMRKKFNLIEGERDAALDKANAYDREANELSSSLSYVTLERDYLLGMVEWHAKELTEAWEKLEAVAA